VPDPAAAGELETAVDPALRRRTSAERYRPNRVQLLLIGEAPPSDSGRYFYFPDVSTQDSLFRYVVRSVLSREPGRGNKAELLSELRNAGVYLIDICEEPVDSEAELRSCLPGLIDRARRLAPTHVILIKATVYDTAYRALKQAGLPVVDARVPFPGSGRQLEYERAMAAALADVGWTAPETHAR
jgi:hypothetical protein